MTLETHRILQRVRDLPGVGPIDTVRDCDANELPDRRVLALDDRVFVKAFRPDARDCYVREKRFLELAPVHGRSPELIAAMEDEDGGLVVMTRAAGTVLDAIYGDLDAATYAALAGDLGACLAEIHAVPLGQVEGLPANTLERDRRSDHERFASALDDLTRANLVTAYGRDAILDLTNTIAPRRLTSPSRLIHADVHNENVFVTMTVGPRCTLIDFEEAAPSPVELDLVHPVLNILGEAFPTRRLAAHVDPIRIAFLAGYTSVAGEEPDLLLVADHALAWYLTAAVACRAESPRLARFYTRTALGALSFADETPFERLCPSE